MQQRIVFRVGRAGRQAYKARTGVPRLTSPKINVTIKKITSLQVRRNIALQRPRGECGII